MPNRSTRDERDAEGNPMGDDRHVAGPASDSVRRAAIADRLKEKDVDSRPSTPPASTPDRLNPANDPDPTKDLSIGTAARRIRGYKQKLDDEIESQGK